MMTYRKAQTLADALDLLGRPGVQARALMGGTDLLVSLTKASEGTPQFVVDPNGIKASGQPMVVAGAPTREHDATPQLVVDLKGITDWGEPLVVTAEGMRIGPRLTMAELADDPDARAWYPALTQAAEAVGSIAIRNRATVVGNICNASPASDSAPPLLVHEATVRIASTSGERSVPISSFFLAPRVTLCARGEIVTAIELPRPVPGTSSAYRRLTRRWGVDLITVSVAAAVHGDGRVLLGLGAVGPTPLLVELPAGVDLDDKAALAAVLDEALSVATPITNIRGSAEYRAAMLRELADRAIREALESTRRSGNGRSVRS